MKSKVVPLGPGGSPSPAVTGGATNDEFGPPWLSSSYTGVGVTAFIALSSFLGGQMIASFVGLSFGWAIAFAMFLIVVEFAILIKGVDRLHKTYAARRTSSPRNPMDIAA